MDIGNTSTELTIMLQSHDFIVIADVEHTCTEYGSIPPEQREVIELGAVLIDIVSLEVIDEFSALIRPQLNPVISDFCNQLTGITQAELDNAESFQTVFSDFLNWYSKNSSVIFATWGSYDLVQLNIDCANHSLKPFAPPTILNLKKAFKSAKKLKKPIGLAKAMELCKFEFDGSPHRAIDDAKNTARLLPIIFGNDPKLL